MKSKLFSTRTIANMLAVALAGVWTAATACGPYYDMIPTPRYFATADHVGKADLERQENLRLWQEQTSKEIPLEDIEQAVYRDNESTFAGRSYQDPGDYSRGTPPNKFYAWIDNTRRYDIRDFLLTAKRLEKYREKIASPWYYPSSPNSADNPDEFQEIVAVCEDNKDSRLRDRYGLQAVRALFAAGEYAKCISYYDEAFADVPDTNLMKRMAKGYVAGCWSRLGETDRANEYFAETGDLASIKTANPISFLAERNPDAPSLMEHIRAHSRDTAFMRSVQPVAREVVSRRKAKNLGDWEFLLGYTAGKFDGDQAAARHHIDRALRSQFSSEDFRDHARAYRMALDGDAADSSRLLGDLRWIEEKIDPVSPYCQEWNRLLQNIVYAHWLPSLLKKKDYATAVLLTGYAENLMNDKTGNHDTNYGGLTFQLMNSLTSDQLDKVKGKARSSKSLYRFLARHARTDSEFFDELIGTIALREERYDRAAKDLAKVTPVYQRGIGIYEYLDRNPFTNYPDNWASPHNWRHESTSSVAPFKLPTADNAKLNFARKMARLQRLAREAKDPDTRGMAALEYAIGRRNSLEHCWGLTQYWCGWPDTRYDPSLGYAEDFAPLKSFLYDYNDSKGTAERYRRDVDNALATLATDEARARAQLMLNNIVTVIRRYPTTAAADFLRRSCDNWRDWLPADDAKGAADKAANV